MCKLGSKQRFIEKHIIIVLILLILIQLLVVVLFGTYKESYHLDELFTFGLSNSYFLPFLSYEDISMKWLSPGFYNDYFTVQPNERFAYDSVYYNQVNDVHPPFYYYLIHTVCSLFPNIYSKWLGIGVNMIFLAGTVIVLFFLSRLIIDNNFLAIVICASYGFSAGAVSNAVFIRMYMMLTLFTVLTTYLHGLLIVQRKHKGTIIFLIMIVNIFGFLTQYFFVIYAFFIACGYAIYLIKNKTWRTMLIYTIAMLGCVVISIIIFPECLKHILFGYWGNKVISNFSIIGDLLGRFVEFIVLLCKSLVVLPITTIFITIIFLENYYKKAPCDYKCKLSKNKPKYFSNALIDEKKVMFDIVIYSTVTTFLIIAKIALFYEGRYLAFILPNITMISLFSAYIIIQNLIKTNNRIIFSILTGIIFMCTVISDFNGSVDYLYQHKANDLNNTISNYIGYEAYCVSTKRVNITIAMPLLSQHLKSCYVSNSEDILAMISENGKEEPLIVYFPHWDEEVETDTEILDVVVEMSEYNTYEQLVEKEESGLSTNIYLLK